MTVDKISETHASMSPQLRDAAFAQPELTGGIRRRDVDAVCQDQIEAVEVSSRRSQMEPGKQEERWGGGQIREQN